MAHPYGPEWAAAGDADRNRAVAVIRAAHAAGRISDGDAAYRHDAVGRASTQADLRQLVGDLDTSSSGPSATVAMPTNTAPPTPYPYWAYPVYAPPPGYGPPMAGYPIAPGWQPPPPAPSPEPTAVGALIAGLGGYLFVLGPLAWIPGVVLGHIAVRRINRQGRPGRSMALAGLILSWIGMAITVAGVIAIVLTAGSGS